MKLQPKEIKACKHIIELLKAGILKAYTDLEAAQEVVEDAGFDFPGEDQANEEIYHTTVLLEGLAEDYSNLDDLPLSILVGLGVLTTNALEASNSKEDLTGYELLLHTLYELIELKKMVN